MATYAIGDIQGCYQSFRKLLNKISFDPVNDRLWLAGDMINRGPDSLKVMEFILNNRRNISCVLGNHDLHFLAVANECHPANPKDTFYDILDSDMKYPCMAWLCQQPLARYSKQHQVLMVHAGLPAIWSYRDATRYSREVSKTIQSPAAYQFYLSMYGNQPTRWDDALKGLERLRFITNALTRMRYCYQDGSLELDTKSTPGIENAHLYPWFELENTRYKGDIVFGHWASLMGKTTKKHISALDTGCVWGRSLTAMCLDDRRLYSVKSIENNGGQA